MNPQRWTFEAFALHESLYSFMPTPLFHLNQTKRILEAEPSKFKRILFALEEIINIFILWVGGALYVFVKWLYFPDKIEYLQAIAALGILFVGTIACYNHFIIYRYVDDQILGQNSLLQMHAKKTGKKNQLYFLKRV